MKQFIALMSFALLLTACSTKVELPGDPEGVDEMRKSPCACTQLDYKGASFKWLG